MKTKTLTLLLIFGMALMSCHSEKHHSETEEMVLEVTSPTLMDTMVLQEYVCQIHAINHIELRAQEHGFLEEIYVDEGQFVKKGQPLFQIMPALYQAEVQKAEAELAYARIEYENTKMLADSNVVSANQLALAEAHYTKAKAELSLAKIHLGFTKIVAPYDGIVDKFHVRLGSLLEEGELLTKLSDNSQMWVYFNVSETEYLNLKSGIRSDSLMHVQLLMANGQLFPYEGVVETIEADFNHETGNIAFRATFPNPDGLLRHGETGNIWMKTPIRNALLIPQKATFEILDKNYVYVLDEEGNIHARQIEIAEEMQHLYAVSKGLEPTDKILLEGLRKVKDGDHIEPKYTAPEVAFAQLGLYAE